MKVTTVGAIIQVIMGRWISIRQSVDKRITLINATHAVLRLLLTLFLITALVKPTLSVVEMTTTAFHPIIHFNVTDRHPLVWV